MPISLLILCGGQSTEHAISLLSARNIIENLDAKKYCVSVVFISQTGEWQYYENKYDFLRAHVSKAKIISPSDITADCVFPVLHGTNGEDGVIQGLLELLQLPYVGADVLGSAIGMDKDIAKRLLRDADLLVVDWCLATKQNNITYAEASQRLGEILFVKPNSLGSSVATHKVTDEKTFQAALADAFLFDEHVLIEKAIVGREIECSVLGNEHPRASLLGEIINHQSFYSYEAKYIDPAASEVKTPADLPEKIVKKIQTTAIAAFKALRCKGMARVDFFLSNEEKLYINEINTIPGFTNISMYPKNWAVSGLSYVALLDELITLAITRFHHKKSLLRIYRPEKETCPQTSST
ncbi:MAG TPA: D-alanine--D-alanine ligase family protein [Coxiellaceae bacterium]|nr:D-alanine--D-alanine ligase family protein [Coxiellaceae bacterium]